MFCLLSTDSCSSRREMSFYQQERIPFYPQLLLDVSSSELNKKRPPTSGSNRRLIVCADPREMPVARETANSRVVERFSFTRPVPPEARPPTPMLRSCHQEQGAPRADEKNESLGRDGVFFIGWSARELSLAGADTTEVS